MQPSVYLLLFWRTEGKWRIRHLSWLPSSQFTTLKNFKRSLFICATVRTDVRTDMVIHARAHFPLNTPPFPHNIIVTPAWTVQLTLLTLDPWRPIPLHYSLSRPPGQKWHSHSYPEWTWYTGRCISQKISKWIITSSYICVEAETLDISTYWDVYLFMLAIYVYLFIRRMVGTNYLLMWHYELLFSTGLLWNTLNQVVANM